MLIRNIIIFIVALIVAAIAIHRIFKDMEVGEIVGTIGVSFALASVAFAWGWFVC